MIGAHLFIDQGPVQVESLGSDFAEGTGDGVGQFLTPLDQVMSADSSGDVMRGADSFEVERPHLGCLMKAFFERSGAQMHHGVALWIPASVAVWRHAGTEAKDMAKPFGVQHAGGQSMAAAVGTTEDCPAVAISSYTELGLGPLGQFVDEETLMSVEALVVEPG